MIPVILSGGSGTRLWPLSRTAYPKQFLPLSGELTMLQLTARRVADLPDALPPLLVCNEEHRFLAAEQLHAIGITPTGILLEPFGRNTAPAVAVAALAALKRETAPLLLVLPADHLIPDIQAFHRALKQALPAAHAGMLVTFGIVPTAPETGYGYIKAGEPAGVGEEAVFRIDRFIEKPDLATAREYLLFGDYYWNSGMFLLRADRYLEELGQFEPEMVEACRRAVEGARVDTDFVRLQRQAFEACPSNSIDYAVMERTRRAVVVPLKAGWNDIGSWCALHEVSARDTQGNVLVGDVLTEGTENCYIRAEERLVATVGVKDHIVVETADAVLVAHRDHVQDVKRVVERLKEAGRGETAFHRRVYRPWGWYEGIARSARFLVKHIMVKPGAALSLQMHHHRAEHWVVVKGTARVTCGEAVTLYTEDQSTYIPLGTVHRLENPGVIPLELIEIQSGSYLGEDDIVRLDDQYGREGGEC